MDENKNTQNDKVKGRSSETKSKQMTAPVSKKVLLTGSSRGGGCCGVHLHRHCGCHELVWTVRIVVLKYEACTLKRHRQALRVPVPTSTSIRSRLPSAPETEAEAPKDVPTQRVGGAAAWCRLVLTQVRELVPMSRGMILGSVDATEGAIDAGIVAAHVLIIPLHPATSPTSFRIPQNASRLELRVPRPSPGGPRVCGDSVGVAVLRTLCARQPRRGRRRVHGRRRAFGGRGTAYVRGVRRRVRRLK
jgi:hypothetical protein